MKRLSNIFVVLFALAAMPSCYQDEIAYVPTPTVGSNSICFNVEAQWENEDEISRSSADCNRLGMHTAKSADGSVSLPIGVYEQDGICTASAATRGAKFDNAEDIKTLGMQVWANYTVNDTSTLFFPIEGEEFAWDTVNNYYISDPQYFWPGAGTIDFVAITNAPADSFTANLNSAGTAVESLSYTVPNTATEQNDIVIATASVSGDNNESVAIDFKHAMAAVNVKIGSVAKGEILSIKLTNIYNKGSFYPKQRVWVADKTSTTAFDVEMTGGKFVSNGSTTGNPLVHDADATFMMIPQNPGDNAEMEIVFKNSEGDTKTLKGSIAGDNWDMGKTISYVVSIGEDFTLNIEPVGKKLDAHYVIGEVRVTTDKIDNWEIRVSSSDEADITDKVSIIPESEANPLVKQGFWTDKVVDANGNITNESARGTSYWTGSGNVTDKLFYIFIPENITDKDREITITLKSTVAGSTAQSIKTLSQKYPNWTADGFGWEVVDDAEQGRYGFKWTRKVIFEHKYGWTRWFTGNGTGSWYKRNTAAEYATSLINQYNAGSYASYGYFANNNLGGERMYIYIDYTKLNNLSTSNSPSDGYNNTIALFNQGGGAASQAFETAILTAEKTKDDKGYADDPLAFRNLTSVKDKDTGVTYTADNGSLNDLSGILTYVLKKNRYNMQTTFDGYTTTLHPIISENDIKWYLPAYGQFNYFTPDPNIAGDDKANYWSSTAVDGASQAYIGDGTAKDRDLQYRVIAVRRDEKGYGKATVTVDNSSIAGGENGSTNNWLE